MTGRTQAMTGNLKIGINHMTPGIKFRHPFRHQQDVAKFQCSGKAHKSSSSVADPRSNEKHTPGSRDHARNTNITHTACSSDTELFRNHSSLSKYLKYLLKLQ